ncbi:MAG TPA: BTAD domain-containing putative transcriptional regulator, partial [Acidimicrobiales bacterium]|nr:BTAD domain-containing putative transcriptional regulator [Acidimicrobiales bacterium]
ASMLDEAMTTIANRPRRWAYLLTMRAEVLLELGHHDEFWRAFDETLRVAAQLHDDQLVAYAHWNAMRAASHAGDVKSVLEHLRKVEANKAQWWTAAGADFCAHAAEDLGRVGEIALAHEHLAMARELSTDAEALIAMAEASLLARHGDPDAADAALLGVPGTGIDPREYWRIELLRAFAAFRRADRAAGPLAARAFEAAAALGLAHLPLAKERAITEQLAGLAAETGLPASLALALDTEPVSLFVLGRCALTRGGRTVALTAGQGLQLLKFVAVNGGRVPSERAIEALWPDVDLDSGRNRLRTVLNRLRKEGGDVLTREAETLVLTPAIAVDLDRFEDEARRAMALGRTEPALAVAVARAAISRYRGELLPDDAYEEWAEPARRHARRTVLELLQLCCDVATASGDLDETRWAVERAIDLAPDDDRWYLTAARTLVSQGRRGAALAVLRRARSDLAAQGLVQPGALEDLERELVGASAA